MSLAQVLKDRRTWLFLLSLGSLTAVAAGWTGFLEARLLVRGGGGPTLLNRAAPWLALGTIFAIPASYIFGWLCDRLGAVWSALLLGLAELPAIYLLWHFPKEVDVGTGICLCLAAACLMGGTATVAPCVLGQLFGRPQVLSVCRVLLPALLLVQALAGPVGTLLGGGQRARLYLALMGLAALGVLAALWLALAKPRRDRDP